MISFRNKSVTAREVSNNSWLYPMSSPDRGEKSKRVRPRASPTVSPSIQSPPNKKINFNMPPKPKILRSKPELEGKGDNLLRQLHANHFDETAEKFPPAVTPVSKQHQLLNDIHAKTHEDIEEAIVRFLRDSITFFSKQTLDWLGHVKSSEWNEALKITLEAVREIIKKNPLAECEPPSEFHPIKVTELLEAEINRYCSSPRSTVAVTAGEIKNNGLGICGNDLVGIRIAARDLVSHSFLEFGKVANRTQVSLNFTVSSLVERVNRLEQASKYNEQCINYLTEEVTQLKLNYTKQELEKAERILKLLGVDSIYTGNDRDVARLKIGAWIKETLGASIHSYNCISITPVLPTGNAKFSPYAILRFLDTSDARHFEHILHKHKNPRSSIRTVRWTITSQDLGAGKDKDLFKAVQDQIVEHYNNHVVDTLGDPAKALKEYHGRMIRLTPARVHFKGDSHIVLDFIDPCDGVAQMYYKPGVDPFEKHDFKQAIPNPKTRSKAETDSNYASCTLKEAGLWKKDKPRWM